MSSENIGADTFMAIDQDIGWLKMYASSMRLENWKDMRNAIENQIESLVQEIDRLKREIGPEPGTPGSRRL